MRYSSTSVVAHFHVQFKFTLQLVRDAKSVSGAQVFDTVQIFYRLCVLSNRPPQQTTIPRNETVCNQKIRIVYWYTLADAFRGNSSSLGRGSRQ